MLTDQLGNTSEKAALVSLVFPGQTIFKLVIFDYIVNHWPNYTLKFKNDLHY